VGGDIGIYFTTSRIGLPHGNWALMQTPRFNKLGYRQPTNLACWIELNWFVL